MKNREYKKAVMEISRSFRRFESALKNYDTADKYELQELKDVSDLFDEWTRAVNDRRTIEKLNAEIINAFGDVITSFECMSKIIF